MAANSGLNQPTATNPQVLKPSSSLILEEKNPVSAELTTQPKRLTLKHLTRCTPLRQKVEDTTLLAISSSDMSDRTITASRDTSQATSALTAKRITRAVTAAVVALVMLTSACSSSPSGDPDVSGSAQPRSTGTSNNGNSNATNNTSTSNTGNSNNVINTSSNTATGTNDDTVIQLDPDDVTLTSRLVAFGGCDALLDYLHEEYSARVGPWGLNNYDVPAARRAVQAEADMMAEAAMAESDDAAITDTQSAQASVGVVGEGPEFSGTNVQESGVDEADIVKTDGRRIFTLASGRLVVVDVANRAKIGEVQVAEGWSYELFINGDSLLLITQNQDEWDYQSGGTQTVLQQIDVSNATPEIVETLKVQGNYISARSVAGTARVVLRYDPQWYFPFVYPQNDSATETAAAANRAAILATTLNDWLPRYTTEADGNPSQGSRLVPCEAVHAPAVFSGFGMTSVLSVPIGEPIDPTLSTAVTAASSIVYASTSSLYVATTRWINPDIITAEDVDTSVTGILASTSDAVSDAVSDGVSSANENGSTSSDEDFWQQQERTNVHRFDITGDAATYESSGEVQGVIHNQFSLSEHDGYLRIVTTTGDFWSERSESQVRVLDTNGSELREVGSVGDIGRGENVQSVRFVGDIGYVVTFRQIDPFYTIDLSDPTNPQILGELKIPGFSSYLHPISDTLVIGVGSDADFTGRITGAKVSLFDVSDLSAPAEVAVWSAPDGWNDIGWDHRAFLWWAPEQLAVLPVTIYGDSFDGAWAGAVALRVADGAITEIGRIDHEVAGEVAGLTDCRRLSASDLRSTDSNNFSTELEYLLSDNDSYRAILACRDGDEGMTGFECYPESWLDEEGQELGLLRGTESISLCWPSDQPDKISRSMVIGDELWTLGHKGWGYFNGSTKARLHVNDLQSLERLAALVLP